MQTKTLFLCISPKNFNEDNIYLRVINKESNSELLKNVPHVEFLDLAFTFHYLIANNEDGIGSTPIGNDFFIDYDIKQLFEVAKANTKRIFGIRVCTMEDMISDICNGSIFVPDECEPEISPMYVVTNKKGISGAALLVYTDVFKTLADTLDSDLYILPSSIHEILVVPVSNIYSKNDLRQMVSDVNSNEVLPAEKLSDNVYIYKRNDNCISLA